MRMTDVTQELPDPLRTFDRLATTLAPAIHRVDVLAERFRERRASGRILPNSVEAQRIELTYHSNAIEGNTLTLRETQLVIEGHAPGSGKPLREIYEARNHDRALRAIEEWVRMRGSSAMLTERDVLDVHAHVLEDIDAHHAGRFRADRVLIKGSRFVPPGSHRFQELLPRMLEIANRTGVHPALHAAELHYNFVAIHPFADGNGRTARLLMNYHLLGRGYPHAIIEVQNRGEYLAALEEANGGECARFAALVLASVESSMQRLLGEE